MFNGGTPGSGWGWRWLLSAGDAGEKNGAVLRHLQGDDFIHSCSTLLPVQQEMVDLSGLVSVAAGYPTLTGRRRGAKRPR